MIKTNLKDIETMCKGTGLNKDFNDIEILGVSTDTRNIKKGNLFIPLIGENFDAHDFLEQAKNNGAIAALVQSEKIDTEIELPLIYVEDTLKALQNLAKSYAKRINPKVISITGSNGKTSTKDLLASILETEYKTHKTMGNLNNHIGVPLTILDMPKDTEFAVIEMGISDFGEMDLLSSIINPDIGIITNATESHLDDLKTKENVAKAKMEFLDNLKDDGLFIYCKDDNILKEATKNLKSNYTIKSYGEDKNSDYYISNVKLTSDGCKFKINNISDDEFYIPLMGSHQVLNGAAALSVANELNISLDNMKKGLLNVDSTGMRNELKKGNNFTILDDSYKSNPSSLKASLNTLYSLDEYDQKIVILGDMLGLGDDIEKMHREIGMIIDETEIDYIIGIGYYSEYIIWEASNRFSKNQLFHFEEKPENIKEIINDIIEENAIILVKASRPLELDTIVDDLLNE